MTLDPDVKKLLEVIEMNHPKDLNAISPVDFRSSFRQSALLFSGPKEEVEEVLDMSFRYDDSEIPLRVYRPHNAGEGAIIYYHGGGFVIGDIEAYDSQCRKIANSSMQTVISVGYRLAPEHKFPTWTYDSFEAYRWVFKNSSKLNINGSKIAVSGDSAGGNLSFVVPLMLLDRSLEVPKMIIALYPFIGVDRFSETWRGIAADCFWTGKPCHTLPR